MKVAVLGNCQVHGLKAGLRAMPSLDVTAFEAWRMSPAQTAAFDPSSWDAIISQPMTSHYNAMSQDNLRASGKPLAFIHNLYFDGLCPDAIYAGQPGARLTGPMGDYHSSIVIDAYRAGLDAATATRLLIEGGASLDPLAAWSKSFEEFKRRETGIDVKFADDLEARVRMSRTFWTFNHPEISLLLDYARRIISTVFNATPAPIALPADDLRINGVWPIYPWVREAHGLTFGGETDFEARGRPLPAAEFVEQSYRVYDQSPDALAPR